MSERLYNTLSRLPIISSITHLFVMRIFFNQFLGGETTQQTIPKMEALRKGQVGTLLGYNIEAELDGSSKDPELIETQIQHVLHSIDASGQIGRTFWPDASTTGGNNCCWVRIKATGLLPHPSAMYNGSNAILESRAQRGLDEDAPYPGLPHDGDWDAALNGKGVSAADRDQLLRLRTTIEMIAARARDNNVRIVIDAEQSWYQPVIDALTDELMQIYNTPDKPATCIASFQAYHRRHPQHLDYQIRRAQEKGYKLLFKQVRGAYMVTEAQRWEKEGRHGPGPIWSTKAETDASFNCGVEKAVSTIAEQIHETGHSNVGAILATHNAISVEITLKLLEKYGLVTGKKEDGSLIVPNEVAGSISFGQIYGTLSSHSNTF